jgi:fumarate reductase subunit C
MAHVYPESGQKLLPPRMSTFWWLEKGSYFVFILREMTCVFVAWWVAYLLMLVNAVIQGEGAFAAFMAWSASAPILVLNIVTFLFLVFHAVTFFDAAPQAMVVKVGPNKVPGFLILAGHYAGWVAISALIIFVLVVGF